MHVLAVVDVLGMIVLFFALIIVGLAQASIALGAMYAMYKLFPDKFPETTYGNFNFADFQKPAFIDLLVQLAVVFVGTTFALHYLDYFLVGSHINGSWRMFIIFMLYLLEVGTLAGGLFLMFKLDALRLLAITGTSAFFHLFFLWYLVVKKFLF